MAAIINRFVQGAKDAGAAAGGGASDGGAGVALPEAGGVPMADGEAERRENQPEAAIGALALGRD